MTRTLTFLKLRIGLAAGTLLLGYILAQLWLWACLSFIIGLLWFLESQQDRDWPASFFLVGWIGMATAGIRMEVGPGWMLLSVVAGLTAWDLHHFACRLHLVRDHDVLKKLERAHLCRLLLVDSLGIALAGIALRINISISLGFTLFLAAPSSTRCSITLGRSATC